MPSVKRFAPSRTHQCEQYLQVSQAQPPGRHIFKSSLCQATFCRDRLSATCSPDLPPKAHVRSRMNVKCEAAEILGLRWSRQATCSNSSATFQDRSPVHLKLLVKNTELLLYFEFLCAGEQCVEPLKI